MIVPFILLLALGLRAAHAAVWQEHQKLSAANNLPENMDYGVAVSLYGGTRAAVCARGSPEGNGTLYTYLSIGGVWVVSEVVSLVDCSAVSIGAGRMVVGARRANNGDGAAYLLYDGGEPQSVLDGTPNSEMGYSVALDDDLLMVGAPGGTGGKVTWYQWTVGEQLPDRFGSLGGNIDKRKGEAMAAHATAALIGVPSYMNKSGSVLARNVNRTDSISLMGGYSTLDIGGKEGAEFGSALSVSGDTALIGARQEAPSGAVYVFVRDSGGKWSQQQRLAPHEGNTLRDWFGKAVAVDGDHAIVTAHKSDVNGDDSGVAYFYRRTGGAFAFVEYLVPSDGAPLDYFGSSVALSGPHVLIGSYRDAGSGMDSGAVYCFRAPSIAPLPTPQPEPPSPTPALPPHPSPEPALAGQSTTTRPPSPVPPTPSLPYPSPEPALVGLSTTTRPPFPVPPTPADLYPTPTPAPIGQLTTTTRAPSPTTPITVAPSPTGTQSTRPTGRTQSLSSPTPTASRATPTPSTASTTSGAPVAISAPSALPLPLPLIIGGGAGACLLLVAVAAACFCLGRRRNAHRRTVAAPGATGGSRGHSRGGTRTHSRGGSRHGSVKLVRRHSGGLQRSATAGGVGGVSHYQLIRRPSSANIYENPAAVGRGGGSGAGARRYDLAPSRANNVYDDPTTPPSESTPPARYVGAPRPSNVEYAQMRRPGEPAQHYSQLEMRSPE